MLGRFSLEGTVYYQQGRKCGKTNCFCMVSGGYEHGPYWYARDPGGKVRYLGVELPDEVKLALSECERLQDEARRRLELLEAGAAALKRLLRGSQLQAGDVVVLRDLGFGSCLVGSWLPGADYQPAMLRDVPGYFVGNDGK